MDDKERADKAEAALRNVWDEISHKHGGPELKGCVSVSYLYRIVADALGREQLPQCEKCHREGRRVD